MSQLDKLEGTVFVVRTVRVVLWLCLGVAVGVGVLMFVTGTIHVMTGFVNGSTTLDLVSDTKLPVEAGSGQSTVVEGRFDTASATIAGLPIGIAAIAAAASIVRLLTDVAVAGLVALLAWRLLRRAVFARSLSLTVSLAGAALLVGGVFSQGFGALAAAMAASDLNGPTDSGFWPIAGRIDFTPLALGVVLVLVGLAFEYGERLQRDTAGLV